MLHFAKEAFSIHFCLASVSRISFNFTIQRLLKAKLYILSGLIHVLYIFFDHKLWNSAWSILFAYVWIAEPKTCTIDKDELVDGLRVLVFKDGLFYEGAVKGIRPPDVYGVVIDNARGNRPYIYSQEEILKEAVRPLLISVLSFRAI